jgi:hypothetical protein
MVGLEGKKQWIFKWCLLTSTQCGRIWNVSFFELQQPGANLTNTRYTLRPIWKHVLKLEKFGKFGGHL